MAVADSGKDEKRVPIIPNFLRVSVVGVFMKFAFEQIRRKIGPYNETGIETSKQIKS